MFSLVTLALTLLAGHFTWDAYAFDATNRYQTKTIEGWTIRAHENFLAQTELASNTFRLLEFQLYQITRVVPTNALAQLRTVPIWIELAHPRHECMCYHPSPEWLREHDMNPEKARAVEIANPTTFLSWTKAQPWMVLHELAHAYHHQVLGHANEAIKAAYQHALAGKSYEQVRHINGKLVRHYALNNEEEYFAEATEAYFGTNDYFPFVRAELKLHDPEMVAVLRKVWGIRD